MKVGKDRNNRVDIMLIKYKQTVSFLYTNSFLHLQTSHKNFVIELVCPFTNYKIVKYKSLCFFTN